MISAQQIKALREKTGAGVADVKKALEESGGNSERAERLVQQRFGNIAEKKASRETRSGVVEAYVHSTGRLGALVEVLCETDFVARSPRFKEFAHDMALHIAAMRPLYVSMDAVPRDVWDAEKQRCEGEAAALGKSGEIASRIVEGKLSAHFGPLVLLDQAFVKDQDKTVAEVLRDAVGKFGENIKIGRFARIEF